MEVVLAAQEAEVRGLLGMQTGLRELLTLEGEVEVPETIAVLAEMEEQEAPVLSSFVLQLAQFLLRTILMPQRQHRAVTRYLLGPLRAHFSSQKVHQSPVGTAGISLLQE